MTPKADETSKYLFGIHPEHSASSNSDWFRTRKEKESDWCRSVVVRRAAEEIDHYLVIDIGDRIISLRELDYDLSSAS